LPQTHLNEALLLAERIRLEVAQNPIQLDDGQTLTLTVSIGVSETLPMLGKSRHQEVGEHLLASADQALYQAKAKGRNRIESLAHTEVRVDKSPLRQFKHNNAS
jgi:diguanylate cyclase (GGDEF)-like protein